MWLMVAPIALLLASGTPPKVLDARQQALQHYNAGEKLMLAEHWDDAAIELNQAVQFDPVFGMAFHDLGMCRMALRDYPAALKAFSDSRDAFHKVWDLGFTDSAQYDMRIDEEIDELNDGLRFNQTLRPDQRNPFTEIKYQDKIKELQKQKRRGQSGGFETPAEVSLGLGSAYLRMGQLEDAEREYQAALKARPRFGEVHNNLAVIYLKTRRLEEAETQVRLAEKAGYTVPPGLKTDIKAARN
jgi:tetratricopeptide (TPR) repeat protein